MAVFWVLLIDYILVPLAVLSVLRKRRDPAAMLAWIVFIIFVPYVGMICYWIFGSHRIKRRARRRRRRIEHLIARVKEWARQQAGTDRQGVEPELPDDLRRIAELGRRVADMPAVPGNTVHIYQEAESTYAALEEAFRAATHHIHAEYYIWKADETGYFLRDLLIEKAREGVECRLLLDAVGCWRLRSRFLGPLREAGVSVAFFLPFLPLRRRWSLHLRNHRKIAVVDGQVGFLGSQNVGDIYRGRKSKYSPWYDAHLRVRGPAALFVQRTFAEDWLFATREHLVEEAYFPPPSAAGDSIVQIVPTGPDQTTWPLEQIIFAAVSSAQESVRIATPYFAPSPAMLMALIHACSRGVSVEIVLPLRTDVQFMLYAARAFYPELLQGGVKIFEYAGGVLHSKIVTIDDRWSMLGSANMDVRSFRLNFELTALLYDERLTRELSDQIQRFRDHAQQVTRREVHHRPLHEQAVQGAMRLISPLL